MQTKAWLIAVVLTAAAPGAATLDNDVGVLLGLRAYATGLMQYCYDNVEARPAFLAAAENWKARNLADSEALDAVVATMNFTAEVQATMDQMVVDKVSGDVKGAPDQLAFCLSAMNGVDGGGNDFATIHPDQTAHVRAAAGR